ncbi:PD-(D/E)XK nuclease domain-containing protein [Sphingobium chungangianum]
MTSLKATKKAAQYLREFMRANTAEWAELMRESAPNKGWGRGNDAHDAHDAAMFLYHETDAQFLDFTIPGYFASGADLLRALQQFREGIEDYAQRLKSHHETAVAEGRTPAPTVGMVYRELEKCRFGVDEAVAALMRGARTSAVTPALADDMDVLKRVAARFPEVVAELSKRRKGRPPLEMNDEYDVQYLFQALLRVEFADIRPEETTPSTAGGSARADCLLKDRKIIIEFKMTRDGYDAVRLRKELADDFVLYANHPDCERLFAFVYDPGRYIANRPGVESDLSMPRPPIGQVVTFVQQR